MRWRTPLSALPAAVAVIGTVVIGVTMFQTFFGDANIYLPFASNTARGEFFSFNPHSFSSGATSPLWTLVLAIPFVIGTGVTGAKVFALAMTVAAVAVTIGAAHRVTGSLVAAGLASLYLIGALAVWGVVMFDSSQVVILVALTVLVGARIATTWREREDGELSWRLKVLTCIVWGLLLFARPDAAVLVAVQALGLWATARDKKAGSRLLTLLGIAVVAAIPSLVYYAYSQLTLGTFSVASRARAYTLVEAASHLGPITYSSPMLGYLLSILFALVLAAFGVWHFWSDRPLRWLAIYVAGAVIGYAAALTFAAPVTAFMSRYFVPTAPLIVIAIARCITGSAGEWSTGKNAGSGIIAAALIPIAMFTAASGVLFAAEMGIVLALIAAVAWLYLGNPRHQKYARIGLIALFVASVAVLARTHIPIHQRTLELGLAAVFSLVAIAVVAYGLRQMERPQLQAPLKSSTAALALLLATGLLIGQVKGGVAEAGAQSGFGYTFNQIEEKDAIDIVNQSARRGDTVLSYEVQDRYLLRDDVRLLSLDGLTDGIATPYLQSGHMQDFIRTYHPEYWIANDAVEYRPSLRRSFLYPVYEKLKNDPTATEVLSDGITFRMLQRRTSAWPRASTGWWRFIVTIKVD